jgi:hypothetical protein
LIPADWLEIILLIFFPQVRAAGGRADHESAQQGLGPDFDVIIGPNIQGGQYVIPEVPEPLGNVHRDWAMIEERSPVAFGKNATFAIGFNHNESSRSASEITESPKGIPSASTIRRL